MRSSEGESPSFHETFFMTRKTRVLKLFLPIKGVCQNMCDSVIWGKSEGKIEEKRINRVHIDQLFTRKGKGVGH